MCIDVLLACIVDTIVVITVMFLFHMQEVVCVAVDKTLSSAYFDLHEPFMKGKTALRGWIQKLYGMQSMIESILRFSPSNQTRLPD